MISEAQPYPNKPGFNYVHVRSRESDLFHHELTRLRIGPFADGQRSNATNFALSLPGRGRSVLGDQEKDSQE